MLIERQPSPGWLPFSLSRWRGKRVFAGAARDGSQCLTQFRRQLRTITRPLRAGLLAAGVVSACASGRAASATPVTPVAVAPLPPELQALVDAARPTWSWSASTQFGAGYKDNLVLSHTAPEASGFVRGGFDFLLMRPAKEPGGRTDFSLFAFGEGTRYLDGESVQHEALAGARADGNWRPGDSLKLSAMAGVFYSDDVLDHSDTGVQRVVVQTQRMVPMAGPTLRWTPRPWWWIEVRGEVRRENERSGVDEAGVREGSAQLGWKPARRFEAKFTAGEVRRRFDAREQFSFGGRPVAGTELRVAVRDWEAQGDVTWDAAGRWKTTTRLSRIDYRDNGSGFFNYRQRRVRQRVEWADGAWRVRLEGSARRLDYELQTVGLGIAPPSRVKEEFSGELRVERRLSPSWSVFGEQRWERSRSNDPFASYRANEGLLGVVWNWDK